MKLARIEHIRCNEYDGTSDYVWIPNDWDEAKLREVAREAKVEYEAYFQKFQEKNPPPYASAYNLDYTMQHYPERYPSTMTLAEAQEKIKAEQKEYNDWEKEKRKIERGLLSFLEDKGCIGFYKYDEEEMLSTRLDWGHNHGKMFKYGESPGPNSQRYKLVPIDEEDEWYG